MRHRLLCFVSRICVCLHSLQGFGMQEVISIFIVIVCGDGLAQGFVMELGGALVHNIMIGYVNKLKTQPLRFIIFIRGFHILITDDWWPCWFWHQDEPETFYECQKRISRPKLMGLELFPESLCHIQEIHISQMAAGRHLDFQKILPRDW